MSSNMVLFKIAQPSRDDKPVSPLGAFIRVVVEAWEASKCYQSRTPSLTPNQTGTCSSLVS